MPASLQLLLLGVTSSQFRADEQPEHHDTVLRRRIYPLEYVTHCYSLAIHRRPDDYASLMYSPIRIGAGAAPGLLALWYTGCFPAQAPVPTWIFCWPQIAARCGAAVVYLDDRIRLEMATTALRF